MKTKVLWKSLCLLLLSFSLPIVSRAQLTYYPNPDQTATISYYAGPGGAVTIPGTVNGLPVTGIANYAFRFNTA